MDWACGKGVFRLSLEEMLGLCPSPVYPPASLDCAVGFVSLLPLLSRIPMLLLAPQLPFSRSCLHFTAQIAVTAQQPPRLRLCRFFLSGTDGLN